MVPREVAGDTMASPPEKGKRSPRVTGDASTEHASTSSEFKGTTDGDKAGKLVELAAEDDNDETSYAASNKAQTAQYDFLCEGLLKDEKASGELPRRSKQAILHFTFTEMRLSDLEKELRALKAEIHSLPDDSKPRGKKKCPVFRPILKRSGPDEFRTTLNSKFVPIDQRPSLEVLYTDLAPSYRGSDLDKPHGLVRRATSSLTAEATDLETPSVPERLRLRSWPLIGHLERVCREHLSTFKSFIDDEAVAAPVVILRPFKVLFEYESQIRDSVHDVEKLANEQVDKGKKAVKGVFINMEYEFKNLLQDLRLLIRFLDEDLKPTFDLRKGIRDGTTQEIEYADLWHLFELGDIVIPKSQKMQAYKVASFTGGREPLIHQMEDERDRTPPLEGFTVDCCSVHFDGSDYLPKLHKFSIRKFNGFRSVQSLDIYPLKFEPKSETLRKDLIAQGNRYIDMTRPAFWHRMLRGRTLDEPPQDLEAQVIVDIGMALTANPDWRLDKRLTEADLTSPDRRETYMRSMCEHGTEGCCGSDYIVKDLKISHDANDSFRRDYKGLFVPRSAHELREDIILLPDWVHGFVLRLRQWVTVKMADLFEVPFENDFKELMISENHKQTLLAVVQTHENANTTSPGAPSSHSIGSTLDLVKGKGAGLILLLHGEPGVGKTSTAECVADKTRRPLFPITCGDIGETAMEVEKNLHHNFRLAHRWGCVLLLDEADVFLAKRNKTDLRRNAVTSVFLRSLEYYAGILFLTTNRVGGIDPAFKSRIHLSVYYPRLDLETTLKLYEVFLRRTKDEQKRSGVSLFTMKNKEILHFAKRHYRELKKDGYNTWNGRQIRNAFQTAIALAEHQAVKNKPGDPKPVLGKEQFKIVAEGSKEFDSYLIRTLQGADDEIAIRDQWRDDRFSAGTPVASLAAAKAGYKYARADLHREKAAQSDISLSETESESESESDHGSELDDDNHREAKGSADDDKKQSGPRASPEGGFDVEEYEEFLRFKAMLKAKGR